MTRDPPDMKQKIVVADDDEGLLHTLGWILKDKGYEVISVPNGEDLLNRLEREKPDLLLLDIMMPKVDGLQLLEQVKAKEQWQDLPVMMISSMQPEEATVKSLGLGAADFIPKPFRVRELLARVEVRLRHARELRKVRDEAKTRAEVVDILHEVTDSLKPDEIYHILTRRVARALHLSKCAIVTAQPETGKGVLVAASENPMLRNLEIQLARYPEIRRALEMQQTVWVADVHTDPLYEEVREEWRRDGIVVPTRSAIALPFFLKGEMAGVFFLRTTDDDPPLAREDASFAETVIKGAVSAIERAYDLEAAKSDREHLERLASTDPLTGCLNRRAMLDKLEAELDRARRYDLELTLLMIDLDWFKEINDTRGHLVGDTVLRQLGDALRHEARSVDVVARYGGEEFTLVLPETGKEGGTAFAERIRVLIESHNFADEGDPLRATVSIGVATFTQGEDASVESMIADADAALYRAKREGRNLVRFQ
jgi:two-component system, cell cycle response regulator